jgi:hypothetical protein
MSSNYRRIVLLGGYQRLVAFSDLACLRNTIREATTKSCCLAGHTRSSNGYLFRLDLLDVLHKRPDLRSRPPLDRRCRLIRLDRSAVAFAPDWHLTLSMGRNYRAAIDDFGDFRERKFTAIGLGDPGQVGRGGVEGACEPTIALPIYAVTRHAGDFIFDNSQMRIVGSRLEAASNES